MEPYIPPFPELRAIKCEVTDGFMAKSIKDTKGEGCDTGLVFSQEASFLKIFLMFALIAPNESVDIHAPDGYANL
jgi:hypothetical protein